MSYRQEQARLQKQYGEDIQRAPRLREDLLAKIERLNEPIQVTDEVLQALFPEAPELLQASLMAGGCRTIPTMAEEIHRFCRDNNLEYRIIRDAGFEERYWFRKIKLADRMRAAFPSDSGRYVLPAELIPDDWD